MNPSGAIPRAAASVHVLLARHALHPAEVVGVTVVVDHRDDVTVATAHSVDTSGSTTTTPVAPSMKVMLDRSKPRT